MQGDWDEIRARLAAVILKGDRSRAARTIGISPGYFHDLLNGIKGNPSRLVESKCRDYLTRAEARAVGVTSPDRGEPQDGELHQEVLLTPSPRTQAIALIESLDDDQLPDLLKAMRRHVAAQWQEPEAPPKGE